MAQKNFRNALHPAQNQKPDELLSTKLALPRLRSIPIRRAALLARLEGGLDRKLTLISAPAGFGKTTLAAEWISDLSAEISGYQERTGRRAVQNQTSESGQRRYAWISFDTGDNDPVRFWHYLLTACQAFDADAVEPAMKLLHGQPQPPYEVLLTLLINRLAQLPGKSILVLEDYHAITSTHIHETLSFLIEHLPETLHFVLLTRVDPPLPLARWRAQNELNELRAADLRFSAAEVQAFLEQAISIPISSELVTRLADRTEGWAAGLRLVALAFSSRMDEAEASRFLATFTGGHRPIQEFLVQEVFSTQPEPVQEFLLQTSFLNPLTASLCDAATGRGDSAQVLEHLVRSNLFITPLDGSGNWFRYHDLFAEAMRHYAARLLGEERLRDLAHRASAWYEARGMLAEAVDAALAAQDPERAAGLIERIIAPRLVQNEFHTLRRWMEAIPDEVLRKHPEICMSFAVAILFTSDRHAPETQARLQAPLQIAEQHWQREENEPRLGEVLAFRSLVAWLQRDSSSSVSLAKRALELLPAGEIQWRGISLIFVGLQEFLDGKLNAARQTLAETRSLCESAENIYCILDSALLLGEVYFRQGELRQAAQVFQYVLTRTENAPMDRNQAVVRLGRARLGLGKLALEWNDLETAEQDASFAVEASRRFPDEDLLAPAPLVLAQVKQARAEAAEAHELLHALIAQANEPLILRETLACRARFDWMAGDEATVERWATNDALPGDEIPLIQREQEALIIARLRIAQGQPEAALQLLRGWLDQAQDQGRGRSEVEIHLLMALAYSAHGDRPQARQALIGALELAQPEGYQRLFLDEGERFAELLHALLPEIQNKSVAAYGRALLYTIVQGRTGKGSEPVRDGSKSRGALFEPLSEQEERVLSLLAAGLSNVEIAQELIVSINTVKTHLKNIYRKLNVNNRRDAREAARHLKSG